MGDSKFKDLLILDKDKRILLNNGLISESRLLEIKQLLNNKDNGVVENGLTMKIPHRLKAKILNIESLKKIFKGFKRSNKDLGLIITNHQLKIIKKAIVFDIEDGALTNGNTLSFEIGLKDIDNSNNMLYNNLMVFNIKSSKKVMLKVRIKNNIKCVKGMVISSFYFLINKGGNLKLELHSKPSINSRLKSIIKSYNSKRIFEHNPKNNSFRVNVYRFLHKSNSRLVVNSLLEDGDYNIILNDFLGYKSGSETNIKLVKKGFEKSVVDYYSFHKATNTSNKVVIKSLTRQYSKLMIRGLIRVDKEAERTNSVINMKALNLNDSLIIQIPRLEILNNNVFVTHSASVQSPSIDELFYLQSRGLNKEKALKQICEAFID